MIQTVIDMRPAAANELATAERAELGRYETVIARGLESFLDVGRALIAIRDGKLYRADYSTFDEYCRGRWNMSRSYAYRTIDAAEVVENLLPIGDILPTNEAQARPLTKLEPAQQRVVWQEAVSEAGGKPTAAQVERAVERVRPPRPKPTPPPSKVVYVEPTPKAEPMQAIDPVVIGLCNLELAHLGPMLKRATVEQLEAALKTIPYTQVTRINRIEGRIRALGEPTIIEPDADDLAQEADDLAAMSTDPDEAEAIALVKAETAQEDAERAARDAQRPSHERVPEPEPVVAPATDSLDRLKRASLLRYMLIQARDAARRDYGELTGRHTDMLEFERGVADMLPPLESLIAILEETK